MIRYCFVLLVFLGPKSTTAQDKIGDMQLIIETVEDYFYGYIERDIAKLNSAFDTENGIMKIVDKTKEGQEISHNNLFKDIVPKWAANEQLSTEAKKNCTLKFLNLEIIEGTLAISTIEMKIEQTVFIDVLSLQKLNNAWKITNKMYVVK